MLVCQITRGVCPARSIVQAFAAAVAFDWSYRLIEGLGIVEAKNEAAHQALTLGTDLLLVEDDIDAEWALWEAIANAAPETVLYARARQRNGCDNVYTASDGRFLWTGTVLVRLPHAVLTRLPQPMFEARKWHPTPDGRDLVPGGIPTEPIGSDVGLWWQVRHLKPPPTMQEIGRVGHLKHPLNERRYAGVCPIEAW